MDACAQVGKANRRAGSEQASFASPCCSSSSSTKQKDKRAGDARNPCEPNWRVYIQATVGLELEVCHVRATFPESVTRQRDELIPRQDGADLEELSTMKSTQISTTTALVLCGASAREMRRCVQPRDCCRGGELAEYAALSRSLALAGGAIGVIIALHSLIPTPKDKEFHFFFHRPLSALSRSLKCHCRSLNPQSFFIITGRPISSLALPSFCLSLREQWRAHSSLSTPDQQPRCFN